MVKALVLLGLVIGIFGAAAYFSYELFIRPDKLLQEERSRPPEPPPPDPAQPEFDACVAVQKKGDLLAARQAFEAFLDQYPHSSKLNAARDLLGEINADLFFSQAPSPEKQVYVVKSGDNLLKVALRTKSTPELIMRSNNLSAIMLRINQRLLVAPADFSMIISPKDKKVRLYNGRRFFKQYSILAQPAAAAPKKGAPPPLKRVGKVVDKMALNAKGDRLTFQDKEYGSATHKVTLSIPGHSLYPMAPDGTAPNPPQNGFGLAADDLREIAVLLSKNDPATIE